MAKTSQQLNTWWMRGLMFVVFGAIAYWFISLALDSAKTIEYLLGIIFLIWAIVSLVKAVRLAVGK